jgi:hypothetical protein
MIPAAKANPQRLAVALVWGVKEGQTLPGVVVFLMGSPV